MKMRAWAFLCQSVALGAVLLALVAPPALAARRAALVIGNGAYTAVPALANPANDATAVATSLRQLGFSVSEGVDLDKSGMERVITSFIRELKGVDVGLIFYAGHGLQVDGRNYLVPIDATIEHEVDLSFQAIALDVVQAQIERTAGTAILLLDACRDNPLAKNLARSMGGTRSTAIGRGLAQTSGAVGTLVAYATQPDNVALDGNGRHSPFTAALLEHMPTPGLEIRQVLTRVRNSVIEATGGMQVPWDHSSLTSDFFFERAGAASALASSSVGKSGVDAEAIFWQSVEASDNPDDARAYLDTFGEDGVFAALARNRMAQLDASPSTGAGEPARSSSNDARGAGSSIEVAGRAFGETSSLTDGVAPALAVGEIVGRKRPLELGCGGGSRISLQLQGGGSEAAEVLLGARTHHFELIGPQMGGQAIAVVSDTVAGTLYHADGRRQPSCAMRGVKIETGSWRDWTLLSSSESTFGGRRMAMLKGFRFKLEEIRLKSGPLKGSACVAFVGGRRGFAHAFAGFVCAPEADLAESGLRDLVADALSQSPG